DPPAHALCCPYFSVPQFSVFSARIRRQVFDFADFDSAAEFQTRTGGGQFDGFVVIRGGDDPVTADDLLGLGVRTIRDNLIGANAGNVPSGFFNQLVQTDQVTGLLQTFRPVVVFLNDALNDFGGDLKAFGNLH